MSHGFLIQPFHHRVHQGLEDVHRALVTERGVAVQVVAVEQREAEPDQRHLVFLALVQGVALDELAVGIADQEIGLVGEHQRAQMPKILADVDFGALAVGRILQQLGDVLGPALVAVVAEDVQRLRAQFQQELAHAGHEIGIAEHREALAVQPGM